MARVVWSRAACADLKEIASRIRADSPAYAKSFALRLRQRTAQIETFPDSGRLVPEDPTQTYRELIVGNYRVVYRHDADTVTIVTVVHGARLLRL
jgi:addiction module RelE/StbE family toxin